MRPSKVRVPTASFARCALCLGWVALLTKLVLPRRAVVAGLNLDPEQTTIIHLNIKVSTYQADQAGQSAPLVRPVRVRNGAGADRGVFADLSKPKRAESSNIFTNCCMLS